MSSLLLALATRRLAAARHEASRELERLGIASEVLSNAQRTAGVSLEWKQDVANRILAEGDALNRTEYRPLLILIAEAREIYGSGIRRATTNLETFLNRQKAKIAEHTGELGKARDSHAKEIAKIEQAYSNEDNRASSIFNNPHLPQKPGYSVGEVITCVVVTLVGFGFLNSCAPMITASGRGEDAAHVFGWIGTIVGLIFFLPIAFAIVGFCKRENAALRAKETADRQATDVRSAATGKRRDLSLSSAAKLADTEKQRTELLRQAGNQEAQALAALKICKEVNLR